MKLKTLVKRIAQREKTNEIRNQDPWRAIRGGFPNSDQRTATEVSSVDAGDCTVVPDACLAVIGKRAVSLHRIGLLAIRYFHDRASGEDAEVDAHEKLVRAIEVHKGKYP